MAGLLNPLIGWVMANGALILALTGGFIGGVLYMNLQMIREIDAHVESLQYQARILGALRVYEGRLEEELGDEEMEALRQEAREQGSTEQDEMGLSDAHLNGPIIRFLYGKFK